MKKTRFVIHGYGFMGKAFAKMLCLQHEVVINPTSRDVVDNGFQTLDAIHDDDVHVMSVSSHGLAWFIKQLHGYKNLNILMLTKGLHLTSEKKIITLTEYLSQHLHTANIACITGPCLASDLLQGKSIAVNLSGTQWVGRLAKLLQTPTYHVLVSHDMIGCQWVAALKNVYAMLCSSAQAHSISFGSIIFQSSLLEMSKWLADLGADSNTITDLSGVGDLYVTTNGGRNGRFGQYLGQGHSPEEIVKSHMSGVTVEGLNVIGMFLESIAAGHMKLECYPLFMQITQSVVLNKPLEIKMPY